MAETDSATPRQRARILVVEDEPAIRTGLVDVLVFHGHEVQACADGREALQAARAGRFHLILLDVMLPGMNGFEVCDAIRGENREVLIIMLTAKVSEEDIVTGLKLGADDYIGKPFSVTELVHRVQAVLRRSPTLAVQAAGIDLADGSHVDSANLVAHIGGREVAFTRREMQVLTYLAAHHERPVSREELLAEVWGYRRDANIETRTVDIHMAKLRRKIERDPRQPANLVTIRGAGYRLPAPSDATS